MAARILYKPECINLSCVLLTGCFEIAASGGAATVVSGRGYKVAKSATGEYTITLDDAWFQLISANFTIETSTPVDLVPQLDNHDVKTNKTIVVNLNTGATPTEPSAITRVHFTLALSNTSVRQ